MGFAALPWASVLGAFALLGLVVAIPVAWALRRRWGTALDARSGEDQPKWLERVAAIERATVLRCCLATSQALTILITWDLWGRRDYPPLLPLPGVPVPQLSVGPVLLLTLGVVFYRPGLGVALHLLVLAYSFMADQTRLQPEVISLALLLLATTRWAPGPLVARAHLLSLWAWSGVHKVLSTGFMTGSALWMYEGLPFEASFARRHFGWMIAGLEMAVALTVALPRTRRVGVVLAFLLHGAILLVLSPLGHDWNEAVWPWNAALPVAATALFWPRTGERAVEPAEREPARAPAVALASFIGLFPVGFYLGLVDAYPAHNLYTDTTPEAVICEPAARSCSHGRFADTWASLDVPLPQERRIFQDYFAKTCRPGELLVVEPRRVRVLVGRHRRALRQGCSPERPRI